MTVQLDGVAKDETILNDAGGDTYLQNSDGRFRVLYSVSRNGLSSTTFYSKSSNEGCYLTIIKTAGGFVVGGYSDAPWRASDVSNTGSTDGINGASNKAFFFALAGESCKLKLKGQNDISAAFIADRQYQDVITLNVCDTLVVTSGPTLQLCRESALAPKSLSVKLQAELDSYCFERILGHLDRTSDQNDHKSGGHEDLIEGQQLV